MTLDEFIGHFPDVVITHEQTVFCHYLERRGKQFLVDFGYENAEALTWADMDNCEQLFN